MAESLTPLIQTLHDSLMVLAPGGWTQLELKFAQTPEGLRLSELNARGDGSKAPRPRPDLHIDPKLEAERLSEGVSELQQLLAQQKKATWAPGSITVSRTPDFADYKLLKADGSTAWFTRLQKEHLDSLLMTDALFDMMEGTQRAFHDLQGRLEARLRNTTGFAFEPQLSSLSLRQKEGPPLDVPALVIGQYYPDAFTWTWGWAHEDANPHTVERVRRVCAPDVTQPGLSALWRSQFHCDEGFAWTLAGSIVVSLGARGLFRAELPEDDGVIFFALMADP
ncbi:MAG: hypothetical protein MUC96_31600 [Myxococcaceae bacterium]|jgi:hypothetical protein|nr:hypothetical protein [Myxococcaceae bacterium]